MLIYKTLLGTVPDVGWFAYPPLSGPEFSPGLRTDFWVLALGVAEVAAIAAGVEIIIAILRMRPRHDPGPDAGLRLGYAGHGFYDPVWVHPPHRGQPAA